MGATESVPIATSIVSGLVRHPAVLAMEIAGISRRESVTLEGTHFSLDGIGITHPAAETVPIAMGVSGPMLLRPAGELAPQGEHVWELHERQVAVCVCARHLCWPCHPAGERDWCHPAS